MRRRETDPIEDQDPREDAARREDQARTWAEENAAHPLVCDCWCACGVPVAGILCEDCDEGRHCDPVTGIRHDLPSPGAPVERAGLARDEAAMRERGRHRAGGDAWEDFVRHATIVEIEWPMRVSPEPELSPDEPEREP